MTLPRGERWVLAGCVLLAVGAYAQTAGYGFVYDDVHVIRDVEAVHSLANWRATLTTPLWFNLFRPVSHLSFAVDWAVAAGDARYFHVLNVLLHAAVSALVYLLARGGLGVVGAGAAAMVFAVHPVHVEAVANLVGRAELLAALFTLLAALAYRADGRLATAGAGSWRRGVASFGTLAALALGLGSKETAFAAPGALLLVDWLEGERTGEPGVQRFRRHWVLWAATVALSLEWLWLRTLVVGGLGGDPAPGLEELGFGGRTLAMAPVVLQYARLFFWPLRLSADYSPDFLTVVPHVTPQGIAGALVVAAALIAAVRCRHRAPPVAFAIAWMAGTLLIVSNLVVPSEVLLAERTLYLPSVGAALLLGWLVAWLEAGWRGTGVALTAAAVGLGMARTVTRNPVWHDNDHFFPQLIREAPGSFRADWIAGNLAYQQGDHQRGEALVRRALATFPLNPSVWETLGYQLEQDGKWLEAARAYQASFMLDSTDTRKGLETVQTYLRAGMVDSAAAVARRMASISPDDFRYFAAMAELETARGRFLAALSWQRRIAWQFPNRWEGWYYTALAALRARHCGEARHSTERIRALQPDQPALVTLEAQIHEMGCPSR